MFVFNWGYLANPALTPWYSVSTVEGEAPYALYTTDGTTHLVFRFSSAPPQGGTFISDANSASPGRVLVWLEQEGPSGAVLESKYDLVQAATINMPLSSGEPSESLESVVIPAETCTGPMIGELPIVGPLRAFDPTRSTSLVCDVCSGSPSPIFLNSEFCQLSPNCGSGDPCYTPDKNVRIVFTGAVRAAEGIDPPVFVRKTDGDPSFNYASVMSVQIQHLNDVGLSDAIVISGNGATLLVPGTYEVTPIKDGSGAVVSPLSDAYSPEEAGPVQAFHLYLHPANPTALSKADKQSALQKLVPSG